VNEIRKVVKYGNSLTIALPAWWARQSDMDKGDEVELVPKGADLIIRKVVK